MSSKKIIFLGDHGANTGGATAAAKAVGVGVNAENPDVLIIGGDTYTQLSATTSYTQSLFTAANTNLTKAKTTWTPGNHDNGGSPPASGDGDWSIAESYLGAASLLRTNRNAAIGSTYFTSSISTPAFTNNTFFNTDQYIDVVVGSDTWRLILVNSGARLFGASHPGWPGPEDGSASPPRAFPTLAQLTANTADEAKRVNWLRGAWRPDGRNILITHHERISAVGSHFDNPEMNWLWRECFGANTGGDGVLHTQLYISGHDHNHQIFKPHTVSAAKGVFAATGQGVVHVICAKTGEGTDTGASPAGNTNASDLQFGNTSTSADGYLLITLDDVAHTATVSLHGSGGALLANTAIASGGTQPTGPASVVITAAGLGSTPLSLSAPAEGSVASMATRKTTRAVQALTAPVAASAASIVGVKHSSVNTPQAMTVAEPSVASMVARQRAGVTFAQAMTVTAASSAKPMGVQKHTGQFVNMLATLGQGQGPLQPIVMDTGTATGGGSSSVSVVPSSSVTAGDTMVTALSVVGANIAGSTLTDTFTRTVAGGLGTADSGQVWAIDQAPASEYAVNGSAAVISAIAGNAPIAHLPVSMADCEAVARFEVSNSSQSFGVQQSFGFALRLTDALNYFRCIVNLPAGGGANLLVQRQVANVNTDIISSTPVGPVSPLTFWWMRFRLTGYPATAQVKFWQDGTPEPVAFQYVGTDAVAAGNAAGFPGVRMQWVAGATSGTSSVLFDNYQAVDLSASGVAAPAGWALRGSTSDASNLWTGVYTKQAGANEAANTYSWQTGSSTGQAAQFNGTQLQRIEVPNNAGGLDVNNFTIAAWVKPDFSIDTDPLHQRYEIMEKAGSFWFNIREDTTPKYVLRVGGYFGGAGLDTFTGTTPLVSGQWAHVAGVYDGANLTTYVNGVLDQQVAQTGVTNTGATITGIDEKLIVGAKHRLGHAQGGVGTNEVIEALWNGAMDDFRVYNAALSKAQVQQLMNGTPPASPVPILSFDFESIVGQTVPDTSGHGENGTGQQGAVGAASAWNVPTVGSHGSGGSTGMFATMVSGSGIDPTTPVRSVGTAASSGVRATAAAGTVVPAAATGDEVILVGVSDTGPRPWSDTGCALGIMPNPTAWSTQADGGGAAGDANVGMGTLETVGLCKFAFAHSMVPWDCSAGAAGNFNNGSYAPAEDFGFQRFTYMSWPRPRTAPGGNDWTSIFSSGKARPGGGTYTGDPLLCFQDIAAGKYNTLIDGNATAFAAYGHPIFCRLFWEFNGGGIAWGIGKSGTQTTTFSTAFVNAWKLIVSRTRAIAPNVLFHWNPQNFATVAAVPRSAYWPGATFVDSAGTEGYMSPGDTFITVETDGSNDSDGKGTYLDYGPAGTVAANTVMGNGEGGNRWNAGGADDTAAANRTTSLKNNIASYPAWKNYIWWNGTGSNGNSRIEQQPGVCQTAFQGMAAASYMKPKFTSTFTGTPAGWLKLLESRNPLGGAVQTNFGSGQCGQVVLHKPVTANGDVATPALSTYGFGHYNVVGVALRPASSGGGGGGPVGTITPSFAHGVTTWVDTGFESGVVTDGGWSSQV